MTTESAIRAMLDGKKVIRKDFVEEVYAYEKGVFFNKYGMTIKGFGVNDDWEIYEELKPKQTVIIEKWLIKTAFYSGFKVIEASVDFIKSHFSETDKIKLLDTYGVEI